MCLRALIWFRPVVVSLCLLTAEPGRAAPAPATVTFPTSCSAAIASDFNRAVMLLHSFEYPDAEAQFRAILDREPGCAMARWGIAMTLWHPLWERPAAASLETGAAMLADIDRNTLSSREAAYVDALTSFYADHRSAPHEARALRYQERMHQVYRDHPDDAEAAVFAALALLAVADPRDRTYCRQFQAAALLNWVLATHADHPGVLHYLIHAYDYPSLAHLALGAAMVYADVAPESAHAQHMPSHIFTRLGLWDRSIASNHHSTESAAAYTARAGLPGLYDEGVHSIDYLMYALLQVGDDAEAGQLLRRLRSLTGAHPVSFKVAYTYAAAPARYTLERQQWREASRMSLPKDFPWQDFVWAKSIHHFARGLGAARSGDVAAARRELGVITGIADGLPENTLPYWREEVFVHADVLSAWIALAEGDQTTALSLARAAADREDAVDKHPVTPGEVVPARELLADMLLQLRQGQEALAQYRQVLVRSPNRVNAMMGAARAAVAEGERSAAAGYYQQVATQTSTHGALAPRFREAREFRTEAAR